LDDWFRNELRQLTADVLLDRSAKLNEFLRPEIVESIFSDHQLKKHDHSARLWSLLVFELWLQRWS